MTRAILAQWTALARPGLAAGLLGAVALAAGVATVLSVATAGEESGGPGRPATSSIADLERASGVVSGAESAASLVGAIALAVGASVVAGAFSGGTIRNLLVREPRRLRLLAGTWAAIAGLIAAAAALAVPLSAGLAFATAGARGIDTSGWTRPTASGTCSGRWRRFRRRPSATPPSEPRSARFCGPRASRSAPGSHGYCRSRGSSRPPGTGPTGCCRGDCWPRSPRAAAPRSASPRRRRAPPSGPGGLALAAGTSFARRDVVS